MGSRKFLAIADHEAIAQVLRSRPDIFRRSVRMEEIWQEMGLDLGLFAANGDIWKRQRRMVMAGFDPNHVKAYYPSLLKVVLRLQGRWQRAARERRAIDLRFELTRFTIDAIAGLAFGCEVNTLESEGDVIQQHLDKIYPAIFKRAMQAAAPYWRYIKLPADRRLQRSVAEVNTAVHGFIAQARERMRADPLLREQPCNLLEAMIAAADQPDSGLTDRDVAGNVLTMLLAGEDTTANTLAWMIYLLARNPQALHKARDEVLRVVGDAPSYTLEQMNDLDFVEACAHETMRLEPVVPFHTYQALQETTIADIRVPKDTVVCTVMRHDSVDERFVSNPQAFEPQRWMADKLMAQATTAARRVSMPFGAGPRMCPGRYLALLEIKMAIGMLLRRFDIEAVSTPDGGPAQEIASFAMAPVGLRMILRERMERPASQRLD
jgi:cytochrome P450